MTYRHDRRLGFHTRCNGSFKNVAHWFQFLKLLVALLALVNGLFELLALVYTSVRTKETYLTASQRLQDTEDTLGMASLASIDVLGRSFHLSVRGFLLVLYHVSFLVLVLLGLSTAENICRTFPRRPPTMGMPLRLLPRSRFQPFSPF